MGAIRKNKPLDNPDLGSVEQSLVEILEQLGPLSFTIRTVMLDRSRAAIDFGIAMGKFKQERERNKIDPLTGLLNQSAIERQVVRILSLPERRRRETFSAFWFMDGRNFGKLNKIIGHIPGNHVLKKIGELLGSHVRRGVLCGRYGGDEFVIFARGLESREAIKRITERLQQSFDLDWRSVAGAPPEAEIPMIQMDMGLVFWKTPEQGRPRSIAQELMMQIVRKADALMREGKNKRNEHATVYQSEVAITDDRIEDDSPSPQEQLST